VMPSRPPARDDNASRTTLSRQSIWGRYEMSLFTATAKGNMSLKQLAEHSGGRFFSRMSASGIVLAFSVIIEEDMRNRYALS
jgi:hypothetical protein